MKWSDDVTDNPRTDTSVMADVDVSAEFAINTYTLTYNVGTGGHLTGASPQTVNYGADGATVTAVADTGYHFVKWSDDVLSASRTDTDITADLTVSATFAHDTFTLDYAAGANGHLTGVTHQTDVVYGTDGTAVTAVADTGYHFVKWSDDVTDNPRTDTSVMADVDVSAEFAINTYTITVKVGWNLVAAGPGTTFPNILWRWLGDGYQSTGSSEAWKGYWCRVETEQSVEIQTSILPQTITLDEGWNLIGNSSAYEAAIELPGGLVAWVYDPVTGYESLTTLQPGQGAWVKATAAGQQAVLDYPASPGV